MKYHVSIYLLLFISCLFFLSSTRHHVYAQETTRATKGVSISLSPSYTQLLIQPGKSIDIRYELTNWGDPSFFSFHMYQFDTINTQKTFTERDQDNTAIHFSFAKDSQNDQSFFLNSKKKKELKMTILVDENTPQHDYYYALTAYNEPAGNVDEKSLTARIKAGLASTLFITVSKKEDINSDPSINLFALEGSSYPLFGTMRIFDAFDHVRPLLNIKNDGRNFISSNGELTVKNMFGLSSKTPFIPSLILNDSIKTIPFTKNHLQFFLPGKYTATAQIVIHNPHTKETIATLDSSYQFYVIPGKLMVVFGVLIIIFLSVCFYKKKNRI